MSHALTFLSFTIMADHAEDKEPLRHAPEAHRSPSAEAAPAGEICSSPMILTSSEQPDANLEDKREVPRMDTARNHETSSLRSRASRRSTTDEESEGTGGVPPSAEKPDQHQVEEEGLIRRTPLYRSPIRGEAEKWHEEVDTPSQWTSLFYGMAHDILPVL